jgi:hypothetical protein
MALPGAAPGRARCPRRAPWSLCPQPPPPPPPSTPRRTRCTLRPRWTSCRTNCATPVSTRSSTATSTAGPVPPPLTPPPPPFRPLLLRPASPFASAAGAAGAVALVPPPPPSSSAASVATRGPRAAGSYTRSDSSTRSQGAPASDGGRGSPHSYGAADATAPSWLACAGGSGREGVWALLRSERQPAPAVWRHCTCAPPRSVSCPVPSPAASSGPSLQRPPAPPRCCPG